MAIVNLQELQLPIREDIDDVINLSLQGWLTALEMHTLFTHRLLLPLSQATHADGPGLFRLRCVNFTDNHVWDQDENGRRVRSGVLRDGGEVWFNFTFATSPQLLRRTIRFHSLYGIETFVHYMMNQ